MLPPYLQSTWSLLHRTFPDAISEPEYFATLALLYPHMADGNLAEVMAHFTGKDLATTTNDVLATGAGARIEASVSDSVLQRLRSAGLDDWITEDD